MALFTPAKKAFLIASILYACLLLIGYAWYSFSTQAQEKQLTLTTVPVTLSMFKHTVSAKPIPKETQVIQPEPTDSVLPVKETIEKTITKQTDLALKPEPKKEPIKKSPPPKKINAKPQITPVKPVIKIPPTPPPLPKEKTPPSPEITTKPLKKEITPIHPNLSAHAEQSYLSELNTIIAQHAYNSYPRRAKRRNWQGEVLIKFTLLPNGRITRLSLVESSGRQLLDNAALHIFQIKMNQQFKPFPKEIKRTQWQIKVPVSYHLN